MNKGIKSVPAILFLAGSYAGATIYIAPPDIDTYKQKTDQSFYDMYQNKDSAIAKGTNSKLKDYVNKIKTSNKMFEGNTVVRVAQGYVQGSNIKTNTQGELEVFGNNYKLDVSDLGDVKIIPLSADAQKYVKSSTTIARIGNDAIVLSGAKCTQKTTRKVGKSSYTICKAYSRDVDEATFDVITGIETDRIGAQTTSASCKYVTGKSSYFKCQPKGDWKTTQTKLVKNNVINVQDLLSSNQKAIVKINARKEKLTANGSDIYYSKNDNNNDSGIRSFIKFPGNGR